jgi:hypothetical protein
MKIITYILNWSFSQNLWYCAISNQTALLVLIKKIPVKNDIKLFFIVAYIVAK